MKKNQFVCLLLLAVAAVSLTSCQRGSNDVLDDTRSASRHMGRGIRSLGGKHGDSRQIQCREDFCADDSMYAANYSQGGPDQSFIPLEDYHNDEVAMVDSYSRPARETPGEAGSSIPGIESFRDPSTIPGMSGIFKNVYFGYNSNLVSGQDNLDALRRVADYLKSHPNTYVFMEGHTDERGPEAYNLSLGSRRSNAVRNLLIADGVSPDNLFAISHGKERPAVFEHHEEAWTQNRRVEFKIYQR